ncbi:uncharacterized protein LOC128218708 [Mya arenaria]|uniref:uncharacterized protein LOC128218708 n=1 Tax=Mya arenaria TaxID=6604 RepID=UPI0022E61598|nr:uncharacterized protein LOC128218708 [Mya arenaria]
MGKAQGNRASRSVRKRKSGCKGKEKKGTFKSDAFQKKIRLGVSTKDEFRWKAKRCTTTKRKLSERIRYGGGRSEKKKESHKGYARPFRPRSGPQPVPIDNFRGGVSRPWTSLPKANLPTSFGGFRLSLN